MTLFKHQPLATRPQLPLFSQLSNEIDRFFGQGFPMNSRSSDLLTDVWQPSADIERQDNRYIVRADIPGVDPKNINVSMDNGNLVIEGKRESKTEDKRENYYRLERSYGSFYRSFNLPDAQDAKKIEAHCHNGVLEVIVPKLVAEKHKKIEVKVD